MRVRRFRIDGFGMFCDAPSPDLSDGLNIIFGENGTGKTTLLEFVRAVLFGFRDRSRARYEPARGGRHGGELTLAMRDGREFRVLRSPGTRVAGDEAVVSMADAVPAPPVAALLGGVTRDVFENVFAFSLDDMERMGALEQNQEIQARIFSAAAGTGARSAPAIVQKLDREREGLYLRRGRTQTINRLVERASSIADERRDVSSMAKRHGETAARLAEAREHASRVERDHRETAVRVQRLRRLSAARPTWVELESVRVHLSAHPGRDEFPARAVERLDRIEADLGKAASDRREHDTALAALREELSRTAPDAALHAQREPVGELVRGLDHYATACAELPARIADHEAAAREAGEALRQIGAGWNEEDVRACEVGVPLLDAADAASKELSALAQTVARAEAAVEGARDAAMRDNRSLDGARAAMAERLAQPAASVNDLDGRLASVARGRDVNERLAAARFEQQGATTQLREVERQAAANPASSSTSTGAMLAVLAVLAIVVLEAFVLMPDSRLGALAVAEVSVAAAAVALAVLQRRHGQRSADAEAAARASNVDLRAAQARRAELDQRVSSLVSEQSDVAAALSLTGELTISVLDACAKRLQDARDEVVACRQARSEFERLERVAAASDDDLGQRSDDLAKARRALADGQARWVDWLGTQNLPGTLTPAGVASLVGQVRSARQALDKRDTLAQRVAQMRETVDRYDTAAQALAGRLGRPAPYAGAAASTVRGWQAAAAAAASDIARMEALSERIAAAEERSGQLAARSVEIADVLRVLLIECGVANGEDLRAAAASAAAKREIQAQRDRLERDLELKLECPGALAEAEAAIGAMDGPGCEVDLVAAEVDILRLSSELTSVREAVGGLQRDLDMLEHEKRYEGLSRELADVQREVQEEVDHWTVLTACRWLIGEAIRRHEETRQPEIIRRAGEHLAHVTNGAYTRLVQPIGSQGLFLDPAIGDRKDRDKWNRGLKEQTYLALRLGYIQNYCAASEPLPIIMDDVLANSDPAHAQRAAERLWSLCEDLQIIYLTCHPETVEALAKASGGCARVLEVRNRQIVPL